MVSTNFLVLAVFALLSSTVIAGNHGMKRHSHGPARMDKRGKNNKNKSIGSELIQVGTGILSTLEGELTDGIGSWFQADAGRDSTNGRSWCQIQYTDDMPLFAPSFKLISPSHATYSSDPKQWEADGKKACGLEAEITYKGKTIKGYIGDVFDDSWVKTKYSIDILKNLWEELAGEGADSKDQVMQGLTWKLTGKRNPKYAFQQG